MPTRWLLPGHPTPAPHAPPRGSRTFLALSAPPASASTSRARRRWEGGPMGGGSAARGALASLLVGCDASLVVGATARVEVRAGCSGGRAAQWEKKWCGEFFFVSGRPPNVRANRWLKRDGRAASWGATGSPRQATKLSWLRVRRMTESASSQQKVWRERLSVVRLLPLFYFAPPNARLSTPLSHRAGCILRPGSSQVNGRRSLAASTSAMAGGAGGRRRSLPSLRFSWGSGAWRAPPARPAGAASPAARSV